MFTKFGINDPRLCSEDMVEHVLTCTKFVARWDCRELREVVLEDKLHSYCRVLGFCRSFKEKQLQRRRDRRVYHQKMTRISQGDR